MTKIGRWGTVLVFGVGVALASSSARADYVISVVDPGTGLSAASVNPGDPFGLDVVLSGVGNGHNSMDFYLVFSAEGLQYNSYALDPVAYTTGDPATDYSEPQNSALPLLIAPDTYAGFPDPTVIDLHFAGMTKTGTTVFNEGTLVSLALEVPMGYAEGDYLIDAVPDLFGLGMTEVPVMPGTPFALTVVPEPATLALLALGGVAVLRRRRK